MFRIADDEEIVGHAPRKDEQQLPVMLYVTYLQILSTRACTYGYRFIFAQQPVATARAILDLKKWLRQCFGASQDDLILLSTQLVEEEITH